jgi:hypothetical protein
MTASFQKHRQLQQPHADHKTRAKFAMFLDPDPPPTPNPQPGLALTCPRPTAYPRPRCRLDSFLLRLPIVGLSRIKMLILAPNPPNKLFDLIRSHHFPVCRKLGESQGSRCQVDETRLGIGLFEVPVRTPQQCDLIKSQQNGSLHYKY